MIGVVTVLISIASCLLGVLLCFCFVYCVKKCRSTFVEKGFRQYLEDENASMAAKQVLSAKTAKNTVNGLKKANADKQKHLEKNVDTQTIVSQDAANGKQQRLSKAKTSQTKSKATKTKPKTTAKAKKKATNKQRTTDPSLLYPPNHPKHPDQIVSGKQNNGELSPRLLPTSADDVIVPTPRTSYVYVSADVMQICAILNTKKKKKLYIYMYIYIHVYTIHTHNHKKKKEPNSAKSEDITGSLVRENVPLSDTNQSTLIERIASSPTSPATTTTTDSGSTGLAQILTNPTLFAGVNAMIQDTERIHAAIDLRAGGLHIGSAKSESIPAKMVTHKKLQRHTPSLSEMKGRGDMERNTISSHVSSKSMTAAATTTTTTAAGNKPISLEDTKLREININDIVFERCIGGGKFGKVHKALWIAQPVAVKSLKDNQVDEKAFEDFAREIRFVLFFVFFVFGFFCYTTKKILIFKKKKSE
ncbi:hypothetical protein RFI_17347, partial [Reticulomyxa filosa]